ncbi:MAG: hypothetical protein J7497_05270 [Chitinophagaceae bacterium]|nr:hypothetical protein [Chitinophagaceae bacterium]
MAHYSLYRAPKLWLITFALFSCSIVHGQVSLTGAKCVTAKLVYQYEIKGEWRQNDKISICVEGGVLEETGTACTEKEAVSSIRLQWSEGRSTGKITVSSQVGTANLSVSIAPKLNPGFIETAEKQTIAYDKVPSSLSCTQASGGNCSPSFSYQWEQSSDRIKWTPVSGATGRNLSFSTPFKQTSFFRRRVLESSSQTIAYSNIVAVFVIPKKN